MIGHYDYYHLLQEARSSVIHASSHPSYLADIKREYANDEYVASEIEIVIDLFKDEDYSTIKSEYNDHELTDDLTGYRALHLFPRTTRDVVIVYKIHRSGAHIVLHRIGDHDWVYDEEYETMDKARRYKKY